MQFVTNPWDHQRKLVDVCANRENYALFWDMGTGKSKGIIDVLRYKYNKHGRHLRTVIIGPPVVIENWVREFKIHSKIKRVFGLKGKVAERLKIAKHVFADHGDTGCTFITNYEALQNEEFRLWLYNKFRPEVVVLDEAHYIKNGESRRTKHCVKLGKTAMYRFILTGTPILKSPLDLFYLYKFLDQGESFGTAITAFRAKYFLDANALIEAKPYKDWVFRDEFRQEIIERIEAKSMYVSKKECLDLPDLIIQTVDIGMMPEQTKAYKDMKKDFVAYILDQRDNLLKPAVATLAVTKALRLMQIASGFCNVEEAIVSYSRIIQDYYSSRRIYYSSRRTTKLLSGLYSKRTIKPSVKCSNRLALSMLSLRYMERSRKRQEKRESIVSILTLPVAFFSDILKAAALGLIWSHQIIRYGSRRISISATISNRGTVIIGAAQKFMRRSRTANMWRKIRSKKQ